jgi:solute carrier family 35 protein
MGAPPMPTEGTTLLTSKGGAPSASSSPSLVERVKAEAATAAALLLSVLFFMACSCSMLIVNKLALNALPLPFVVLTLQMAFAVVALCCAPCYLRFGSLQDVLRWCRGIPWLFAGMLGSSMLALNFASMAALVVVRNMGPLLALPIERAYQEKIAVSVRSVAAMVVILAGVVLYMYNDVTLDPANAALGLLYMFINLVLAIIHGLLTRRLLAVAPVDISSNGIVVLNNFCSLLPMAFGGVVNSNEWARLPEAAKKLGAGEWALIVASCTVGLGISWAGINVQRYTSATRLGKGASYTRATPRSLPRLPLYRYISATTMLVLTNLNKFVVIGFGIVFLGESDSWQAILGCITALGGGVWYAQERAALNRKKKEEEAAAAQGPGGPSKAV